MDITEFIAARYAEDESIVPSAAARADQVLREIKAKRSATTEPNEHEFLLLRMLAAPYADHPDFDPAWRVEA